jgi:hypothetical protein
VVCIVELHKALALLLYAIELATIMLYVKNQSEHVIGVVKAYMGYSKEYWSQEGAW